MYNNLYGIFPLRRVSNIIPNHHASPSKDGSQNGIVFRAQSQTPEQPDLRHVVALILCHALHG